MAGQDSSSRSGGSNCNGSPVEAVEDGLAHDFLLSPKASACAGEAPPAGAQTTDGDAGSVAIPPATNGSENSGCLSTDASYTEGPLQFAGMASSSQPALPLGTSRLTPATQTQEGKALPGEGPGADEGSAAGNSRPEQYANDLDALLQRYPERTRAAVLALGVVSLRDIAGWTLEEFLADTVPVGDDPLAKQASSEIHAKALATWGG